MAWIVLCGDQAPQFTFIATFVSTSGREIAHVFAAVASTSELRSLFGREILDIAGVTLSSNAAKQRTWPRQLWWPMTWGVTTRPISAHSSGGIDALIAADVTR